MNKAHSSKFNHGTIVDVRTADEYVNGHAAGAINIPLQELEIRMDEIKVLKQPLVLCCASGSRSSLAALVLTKQGITCRNGGAWFMVNTPQQ